MFNRKSIYALNKKDPTAIVYTDAAGTLIRLTRDDFASEEEFLRWKKMSDADYHREEKADHLYYDSTLSLEGLSDEAIAVESAEADFITKILSGHRKEQVDRLMVGIEQVLTKMQRSRIIRYYFESISEADIAENDGVAQQSVSECLQTSRKKLEKFLKKHPV